MSGQVPDSLHRARRLDRRRRDIRAAAAAVRVQVVGPVRPDRRSRAGNRPRLCRVHERVQRRIREVAGRRSVVVEPVKTYGTVAWTDKPVLAVSDDGRDVYISWNGPKKGAPWAAISHDYGQTWTQKRLDNAAERYYFAYDADVLPNGVVVFSQGSLVYPVWKRRSRSARCATTRSFRATAGRHGGTSSSTRSSRARPASPPAVARTSTTAIQRSRPTRTATSSSSTTAPPRRVVASRSSRAARATAASRGATARHLGRR